MAGHYVHHYVIDPKKTTAGSKKAEMSAEGDKMRDFRMVKFLLLLHIYS